MTRLIDINDILEYKPLSINTNEAKKISPFIQEAQEFDVSPFLGDAFYMAIEDDFNASPSLQDFYDLFNGSTYTYSGKEYRHKGLKAVLVYYAYARYVANAHTNQTAFGVVQKNSDHSTAVSEKTIERLVNQANAGAEKYKNDLILFLNRNHANYPLWETRDANENTTGSGSIRLSSVGGRTKIASSYKCPGCGRYTNCKC